MEMLLKHLAQAQETNEMLLQKMKIFEKNQVRFKLYKNSEYSSSYFQEKQKEENFELRKKVEEQSGLINDIFEIQKIEINMES